GRRVTRARVVLREGAGPHGGVVRPAGVCTECVIPKGAVSQACGEGVERLVPRGGVLYLYLAEPPRRDWNRDMYVLAPRADAAGRPYRLQTCALRLQQHEPERVLTDRFGQRLGRLDGFQMRH